MKLIIGGAWQGKLEYASDRYQIKDGWADGRSCSEEELYQCRGVHHFHEYIKRMIKEEEHLLDMEKRAAEIAECMFQKNPDMVVISNEMGYGVVPMDKTERIWREMVGRACICLAGKSDEVIRVICGIGTILKQIPSTAEPEEQKMPCFPLFMRISDKPILVVGAGKIAYRRIRTLSEFANEITVVAPDISDEVKDLAEKEQRCRIRLETRTFQPQDLCGKKIAVIATDRPEMNREISIQCHQAGILVNVSSDQSLCDFQFPSVIKKEELIIGINASGSDHRLVKKTRQSIENCLEISEENSLYQ